MNLFVADLTEYLRSLFVATSRRVFTFFDLLGIVMFIYPRFGSALVQDEYLVRVVGATIFLLSHLLGNFSLYRELSKQISYGADMLVELVVQSLGPSRGSQPFPHRQVKRSHGGFDSSGMPDWATLWAQIRIANIGQEDGSVRLELDKTKTILPSLFNRESLTTDLPGSVSIGARSHTGIEFFFHVLIEEQDPRAFAESLRKLVEANAEYRLQIDYRTVRVEGMTQPRTLVIRDDFTKLRDQAIKYWMSYGFEDLAALAGGA